MLSSHGDRSFVDHLCYLCTVIVMLWLLFIAALWSSDGIGLTSWLSFVKLNGVFVTFSCGIFGQMWYLIVAIPDLCQYSYLILDFQITSQILKSQCIIFSQSTKYNLSLTLYIIVNFSYVWIQ